MEIRVWNVSSLSEPENAVRVWSACSAAVEWREAEVVVLGRLKCILETNRVDRRPEKSEERGAEFGVRRGEKVGSFRWEAATGDGEEREREPRGEEETRGGSH